MDQSQELTIEQAMYWAVDDFKGGAAALAAIYGLNPTVMSNSLNPNNMQHRPNLKHFKAVLEGTKDPRLTNAIGQLADGVFIPVGKHDEIAGDDAILDNMLTVVEAIGSYGRTVRESIANGDVDEGEWLELQNSALEGIKAIYMVLHNCSQLRGTL